MSGRAAKYLKPAVFIICATVIGIVLGRFLGSYELRYMLGRVYCGSYKGVDVYKSGAVNDENYKKHVGMFAYAPDELLETCDTVYFTGEDLPIPVSDLGFTTALGLTQQRTVYVSTESFNADVLIHELFHTYDHTFGNLSENSKEFLDAFDKEKGRLLIAAGTSENYEAEFFATAGALYIVSPEDLKQLAPNTFLYFNGIFGLYTL